MTQTETLERIYSRLPAAAQREALDFLLFLEGKYVSRHPRQHEAMDDRKTQLTERDGLLFIRGSLTGDIDNLLQQERDARMGVLLKRAKGRHHFRRTHPPGRRESEGGSGADLECKGFPEDSA